MAYKCEVKEQASQPVLSIRTRAAAEDLPQVMGQAFGAIFGYMQELGEYPAGMPFAAYYNMDMQDLDVEIGFPVAKPVPEKAEITLSEIPAGKYAACMHTGPYSEMEPTYTALLAWIVENGYEPTGVVYEFYLNDPSETPMEQLQTEIMFRLKS